MKSTGVWLYKSMSRANLGGGSDEVWIGLELYGVFYRLVIKEKNAHVRRSERRLIGGRMNRVDARARFYETVGKHYMQDWR